MPEIDERANALIQLFNILLKSVRQDVQTFRTDISEEFHRLVSTLSIYIDLSCLGPTERGLLLSYLGQDVVLSRLSCEEEGKCGDGWLRLSPRTLSMLARALRCSKLALPVETGAGMAIRVENF